MDRLTSPAKEKAHRRDGDGNRANAAVRRRAGHSRASRVSNPDCGRKTNRPPDATRPDQVQPGQGLDCSVGWRDSNHDLFVPNDNEGIAGG